MTNDGMNNTYKDLVNQTFNFPQEDFKLVNDYLQYNGQDIKALIDTIRLFKSAEFVSGSHGGGLSWIIFCDPGTKFLEIYKKKRLKEHYTYVAHQCKLQSFRFSGVFDDPGVAAPSDPKIVDDGHMVLNIPNYLAAIRQLTTV